MGRWRFLKPIINFVHNIIWKCLFVDKKKKKYIHNKFGSKVKPPASMFVTNRIALSVVSTQSIGYRWSGWWKLNQNIFLNKIRNNKVLHTNSANDYDGTNNPPHERMFKNAPLVEHLQFLIISWNIHILIIYIIYSRVVV